MFANKSKKNTKTKKQINNLVFIRGIKRIILCINFIKYNILLNCKRKKKNVTLDLFNPLYSFIIEDKNNFGIKVKHRIYRQKLMKLQS